MVRFSVSGAGFFNRLVEDGLYWRYLGLTGKEGYLDWLISARQGFASGAWMPMQASKRGFWIG